MAFQKQKVKQNINSLKKIKHNNKKGANMEEEKIAITKAEYETLKDKVRILEEENAILKSMKDK